MLTVEVDWSALELRIRSKRREEVGDRGANMTDLLEGLASIGVTGVVGVELFRRYCHQEFWMKVGRVGN